MNYSAVEAFKAAYRYKDGNIPVEDYHKYFSPEFIHFLNTSLPVLSGFEIPAAYHGWCSALQLMKNKIEEVKNA